VDEALLIVLASDGLWDVTSANLVMRVAYRVMLDHPGDLELLCAVLMQHAITRRSKDDITIIVMQVNPQEGNGAR
jgi:serine/threonine protein phosphatase PrpC